MDAQTCQPQTLCRGNSHLFQQGLLHKAHWLPLQLELRAKPRKRQSVHKPSSKANATKAKSPTTEECVFQCLPLSNCSSCNSLLAILFAQASCANSSKTSKGEMSSQVVWPGIGQVYRNNHWQRVLKFERIQVLQCQAKLRKYTNSSDGCTHRFFSVELIGCCYGRYSRRSQEDDVLLLVYVQITSETTHLTKVANDIGNADAMVQNGCWGAHTHLNRLNTSEYSILNLVPFDLLPRCVNQIKTWKTCLSKHLWYKHI